MQKYETYSDIKNKLIDIGLLISPEQEHDYCLKNRIIFNRNLNGSSSFCSYGTSSDYKTSRVDLTLFSGAKNDKKGKAGTHHFLEHLLFLKSLRDKVISNDLSSNANTSGNRVQFYLEGVNNSKYKNFGVPAVIDDFYEAFVNPKGIYDSEFVKYEKEVIHKEIDQRDRDFYRESDNKLESLLFEDSSFVRVNITGTHETLDSITEEDLKKTVADYLNPKNLSLVVGGEGTKTEVADLFNLCNLKFSSFSKLGKDTIPNKILNPKIKNFMSFNYLEMRNENIKNGMCAVGFVTKVEEEIFSKKEYAMSTLTRYIDKVFFERIRDKGLVYSGYFDKLSFLTGDNIFYGMGYVSSTIADSVMGQLKIEFENLLKELIKNKTLHSFYNEFKTSCEAYPISYSTKIKDFYSFYPSYRLLTNSKRHRDLKTDFPIKYLDEIASKLLESKKVLYKIGDF